MSKKKMIIKFSFIIRKRTRHQWFTTLS